MTTRPWRHSGARSNGKRWSQAPVGPRTGCGGRSLNTLKPFTTGAGSTALWGINHLWTSNTKTIKNEKDPSTCVHKKGGREVGRPPSSTPHPLCSLCPRWQFHVIDGHRGHRTGSKQSFKGSTLIRLKLHILGLISLN